MKSAPNATFSILTWNEESYEEISDGVKLTVAKVTQSYEGLIQGSSSVEYLMAYTVQGTATFVGIERITGTVDGKSGSFVIRHLGEFADGAAQSSWTVVAGSGTSELSKLRGEGTYIAGHGGTAEVTFDFQFSK